MKRKILIFAIVAILVFSTVALTACGNDTVKNKLSYDKMYFRDDQLGNFLDKRSYYVFYKNGTGVFHEYYNYGDGDIDAYSVHFKYVIDSDSEVVYCFYDSFEEDPAHTATWTGNHNQSDWTSVLNFNDKFLFQIDTAFPHFFVTEEFSKSIQNFGK